MPRLKLFGFLIALSVSVVPSWANEVLNGSIKITSVKHKQLPAKTPGEDGEVVDEKKVNESDVKVTLGKDYVSVKDKDSEKITDFAKKRIINLDNETKEYTDVDLHGQIYFRVSELQNRYMLGELTGKSGANLKGLDPFNPFDVQSILSVKLPDDEHKPTISKSTANGTTTFANDGRKILSYSLSTNAIKEEDKVAFRRWIANYLPVHPDIREALVAEKYYPKTLSFKSKNGVFVDSEYVISLNNVGGEPSDTLEKLSEYKLQRDEEIASIYAALDKLGPKPKLPEKEATLENTRKALKEDNNLDAALIVVEYGLMTGEKTGPEFKEILKSAVEDPEVIKFFATIAPKSEEEAKTSVAMLSAIDRKKLSKGNVIDIMRANILYDLKEPEEAINSMKSALTANPLIVGAYHDLGKMYFSSWNMTTAWECFRIANRLIPNHSQMKDMRELEQSLENQFPEFF